MLPEESVREKLVTARRSLLSMPSREIKQKQSALVMLI
jgi:hypothetical protein